MDCSMEGEQKGDPPALMGTIQRAGTNRITMNFLSSFSFCTFSSFSYQSDTDTHHHCNNDCYAVGRVCYLYQRHNTRTRENQLVQNVARIYTLTQKPQVIRNSLPPTFRHLTVPLLSDNTVPTPRASLQRLMMSDRPPPPAFGKSNCNAALRR